MKNNLKQRYRLKKMKVIIKMPRNKIKKFIIYLLNYIIVFIAKLVGNIFYDSKYLKGKYFPKNKYSLGWDWVLKSCLLQKIVGFNRAVPFPVSPMATVVNYKNIEFDIENINIFQKPGNYYQAKDAKIVIGRGCFIACNVGIITTNHDPYDLNNYNKGKDVIIGENCWIGLNSVILPGTVLGPNTIVGAGSIVTKSFEEGYCIIAGNPAKLIKKLRKSDCIDMREE